MHCAIRRKLSSLQELGYPHQLEVSNPLLVPFLPLSPIVPTFDDVPQARELFNMNSYRDDNSRKSLKKSMLDMYLLAEAATPTQFHLLIAAIAKEGRLQRLYTQNIDGIDTSLPQLKTRIPLEKPWPTTIQLHGDLRTARCELRSDTHLSRSNPAIFDPDLDLLDCTACKKEEEDRLEKGQREHGKGFLLPRVWLYNQFDFPDEDAIKKVKAEDIRKKPDAVIVVGTALKVPSAKHLARDMCRTAREAGGYTAWINLKAPPQDLDCFDLVVEGNCETVAMHVSSWWLEHSPKVIRDLEIQILQEKYKLFIARSIETALNRALAEVDNDTLSKILQRQENKSRVLNVEEGGKKVFISAERSQPTWKAVNRNVQTASQYRRNPSPAPTSTPSESSDVLPKLPDCWKMEMSKRLSEVVVRGPKESRESSSVVTKIADLGYKETELAKSLWRLKPGEEPNDEIINAYLELLRRSAVSADLSIEETHVLNLRPNSRLRRSDKLTGTFSIFIPIHEARHYSFAVLRSKEDESKDESKKNLVRWEYYDSLGGKPPQKFLNWLNQRFPEAEQEEELSSPNPKQRNTVDCGLFVLIGIRLMSAGRRHLSQAESDDIIPTFRQRVLAELLALSLNPSSSQFEEFQLKEARTDTILPQVNPAEESGDDRMSITAGDQNNQENNPAGLFVSPSPSDPGEDTESTSSDALYESEEELALVKPSTQKIPRKKKSPEQIASTFAEEVSMIKMLREAVSVERTSQKGQKIENMRLADLWFMIRTEKRALKQRHVHYEFSRQFWAEMGGFNRVPHQRGPVPKATISKVKSKLEITNHTNWKYILKLARRASIWTELVDIFKDDLDHPSVVLCAVPDATYTLETMTLTNRKLFFKTISTLKVTDNGILERLKAADALYWAVMHNNLPASDLPIEEYDKDLPFKETVSARN
jgi:NAD+-dependent protein deacetylase SIR2